MKADLTVARLRRAVSLRPALAALLPAPLAALRAGRNLPGVPMLGTDD